MLAQASATSEAEELQSRLTFYDFNAVYRPVASQRAILQLAGGIGGANLKFYDQVSSSTALGNSNSSSALISANHFQVHGGASVMLYVTSHIFLRPEFDLHYVTNFSQFGSNLVKREMVWVGYSFGK